MKADRRVEQVLDIDEWRPCAPPPPIGTVAPIGLNASNLNRLSSSYFRVRDCPDLAAQVLEPGQPAAGACSS